MGNDDKMAPFIFLQKSMLMFLMFLGSSLFDVSYEDIGKRFGNSTIETVDIIKTFIKLLSMIKHKFIYFSSGEERTKIMTIMERRYHLRGCFSVVHRMSDEKRGRRESGVGELIMKLF